MQTRVVRTKIRILGGTSCQDLSIAPISLVRTHLGKKFALTLAFPIQICKSNVRNNLDGTFLTHSRSGY